MLIIISGVIYYIVSWIMYIKFIEEYKESDEIYIILGVGTLFGFGIIPILWYIIKKFWYMFE
jgi:hypothetical protein